MTKTKKIILSIACVAIVGLLIIASVTGGSMNTAPCVDCGGAGLVDAIALMISDEMIEQFHERGLLVAAYTANNFMQLCYGKSYDLDFLESDYYA